MKLFYDGMCLKFTKLPKTLEILHPPRESKNFFFESANIIETELSQDAKRQRKKHTTMPHIGVTSKNLNRAQREGKYNQNGKCYDAEITEKTLEFSSIAQPHQFPTNPPNQQVPKSPKQQQKMQEKQCGSCKKQDQRPLKNTAVMTAA